MQMAQKPPLSHAGQRIAPQLAQSTIAFSWTSLPQISHRIPASFTTVLVRVLTHKFKKGIGVKQAHTIMFKKSTGTSPK